MQVTLLTSLDTLVEIMRYQIISGSSVLVSLEGREYYLKPRLLKDSGEHLACIALLTAESAVGSPKVSSTAQAEFEAAAKALLESGTLFCTVLNERWVVPPLCWAKKD